jgi:hypothetical protein
MAITSLDTLIDAMGNRTQRIVWNKSSLSNIVAGQYVSTWRTTGWPGRGAIPTTIAYPTSATTGAFAYTNPTGGRSMYLGRAAIISSNANTDVQIHDRLAHVGGLSGTVTTAQTVNADGANAAITTRKGASTYADIQWWLEWYRNYCLSRI